MGYSGESAVHSDLLDPTTTTCRKLQTTLSVQPTTLCNGTHLTLTMSNAEATAFLTSLLNKTLRVHTNDSRMFVGQMKCTDKVPIYHPSPTSAPPFLSLYNQPRTVF